MKSLRPDPCRRRNRLGVSCLASLIRSVLWYFGRMRILEQLVLGLAMLGATMAAHVAEKSNLPSGRPGISQPIDWQPAAYPAASAVGFVGSLGAVHAVRRDFLSRAADDVAAAGITGAIAGAPSDHAARVSRAFRASEVPAKGIAAVIAVLRIRALVPVRRVGTGNGLISTANAGVRLGLSQIAGVALASSVSIGDTHAADFQVLRSLILMVHIRNGGCPVGPFDLPALIAVSGPASLSAV
jgi:hypothetical protein